MVQGNDRQFRGCGAARSGWARRGRRQRDEPGPRLEPAGHVERDRLRPTSSTPDKKKGHAKKADPATNLKKVQHGEWVTQDKAGAFVTREAIRGQVSAVSATSITVKAKDGVSLTFAVAADTKVRVRANGAGASKKAAAAKITDVKTGQQAMVAGTGKGSLAASHIMVTPN